MNYDFFYIWVDFFIYEPFNRHIFMNCIIKQALKLLLKLLPMMIFNSFGYDNIFFKIHYTKKTFLSLHVNVLLKGHGKENVKVKSL